MRILMLIIKPPPPLARPAVVKTCLMGLSVRSLDHAHLGAIRGREPRHNIPTASSEKDNDPQDRNCRGAEANDAGALSANQKNKR